MGILWTHVRCAQPGRMASICMCHATLSDRLPLGGERWPTCGINGKRGILQAEIVHIRTANAKNPQQNQFGFAAGFGNQIGLN